jgi:enoyl-CoA hydratase/carnithine racemase
MSPRAPSSSPELLRSYASLPTRLVRLEHGPASSSTPAPVLKVILDRPTRGNTFMKIMTQDLEEIYRLVDLYNRIKVVVLTGAGKTFCAGADLEAGFTHTARKVDHRDPSVSLFLHTKSSHNSQSPPSIAVVVCLLQSTIAASPPSQRSTVLPSASV